MRRSTRHHPIGTPVRPANSKIGTTTATHPRNVAQVRRTDRSAATKPPHEPATSTDTHRTTDPDQNYNCRVPAGPVHRYRHLDRADLPPAPQTTTPGPFDAHRVRDHHEARRPRGMKPDCHLYVQQSRTGPGQRNLSASAATTPKMAMAPLARSGAAIVVTVSMARP
jgi:hypothetical protein